MDVTETAIKHKKTEKYYSGNKKYHRLKMQLVINEETKQIICLNFRLGHCHDFNLFKKSQVHLCLCVLRVASGLFSPQRHKGKKGLWY
jgi:hypothetical protein